MSDTDYPDDSIPEGQGTGDDKTSWGRAEEGEEDLADGRDKQLELLRQAGMVALGAIVLITPQMLTLLVVVGAAVYMCIAIGRIFIGRLGQAIR